MEVAGKFCLSMWGKKKDPEDDILCTFCFGNLMRVISLTLSSPSPTPTPNKYHWNSHTAEGGERKDSSVFTVCVWHFRSQGGSWPQGILIKKKVNRQELKALHWNSTNSGFWICWEGCLDWNLSSKIMQIQRTCRVGEYLKYISKQMIRSVIIPQSRSFENTRWFGFVFWISIPHFKHF